MNEYNLKVKKENQERKSNFTVARVRPANLLKCNSTPKPQG